MNTPKINRVRFSAGFSLVELVMTMLVGSVITVIGAPSLSALVQNRRVSTEVDALFNGLYFARNSALTQSISMQVCPIGSPDSTVCGTSWESGWMIVGRPAGGTPTLVRSHRAAPGDAPLSAVAVGGLAAASVVFDPRGWSTAAAFQVCDSRGSAYAKSVEVLPTGYVQAGATPGHSTWGGALNCTTTQA